MTFVAICLFYTLDHYVHFQFSFGNTNVTFRHTSIYKIQGLSRTLDKIPGYSRNSRHYVKFQAIPGIPGSLETLHKLTSYLYKHSSFVNK